MPSMPCTIDRRELSLQRESRHACMAIVADGPLHKRQCTGKMQIISPNASLVFWQERLAAALFNFKDVVEYAKLELEGQIDEWPRIPALNLFVAATTGNIEYMPVDGVPMRSVSEYNSMIFELEFALPISARKLKQVSPTSLKFIYLASSAVIIAAARAFGVEYKITETATLSNKLLEVSILLGIEEAANSQLPFKTLQSLHMGQDSTMADLYDAMYSIDTEDLPILCGRHRALVSNQPRPSISSHNNQHGKTEGLGVCYTIHF